MYENIETVSKLNQTEIPSVVNVRDVVIKKMRIYLVLYLYGH